MIQSIKSNSRSKVYRGEREYGERRQIVADSGKIRVKVAPDGQYLSISGSDILSMLNKAAEKHGRYTLPISVTSSVAWLWECGTKF